MAYIEIKHISKVIKGKDILKDINLSLEKGKIYGFIGINGSGKTMLFRIISGLVTPTEGKVCLGEDNLGLIIENCSLYPYFSGLKNLMFLANIKKKIGIEEVKQVLAEVGLDPEDKQIVKKYSLGMKQRLAFAQAIMEKPDILLLDEPTNALDTEGVKTVRDLIKRESNRGATVLLASHNESDIVELCDEVFLISNGQLSRRT